MNILEIIKISGKNSINGDCGVFKNNKIDSIVTLTM